MYIKMYDCQLLLIAEIILILRKGLKAFSSFTKNTDAFQHDS